MKQTTLFVMFLGLFLFTLFPASAVQGQCITCASPISCDPCNPCQAISCPVVPTYAYLPAYSTGWYPGKLIHEWSMRRQARLAASATTYYQPLSQTVPVTTYQPVTTCDPCSGCPVTSYRPVTALASQTCYIPTTAYRPTLFRPLFSRPLFGSAYYSPAVIPLSSCNPCAISSSCSTSGYEVASYTEPSSCCTPTYGGSDSAVSSTYLDGEATPQPQLPAEPTPVETRKPVEDSGTDSGTEEKSTDANSAGFEAPRIVDPRERTAHWNSIPVQTAVYHKSVQPYSENEPQPTPRRPIQPDAAGWYSVPRDR